MAKRISSFLLCFLMILTLIPVGAMAGNEKQFDSLTIGSRIFSPNELSSAGTYTGENWKLIVPNYAGDHVFLYLYDGFNGSINVKSENMKDRRCLNIISEGNVTIGSVTWRSAGDAELILDSKPGSVTKIGTPSVKRAVMVGDWDAWSWSGYNTPMPEVGIPTVTMQGQGKYQIQAKEYGIYSFAGNFTESGAQFTKVTGVGEVSLKDLVDVSVQVSGTDTWCNGIRTGYSTMSAYQLTGSSKGNLHIEKTASLDIRTSAKATNLNVEQIDADMSYHTESGSLTGTNYSCTIPGFIPVIVVDGEFGSVLTSNTLRTSTDGISNLEADWARNANALNLPYTVTSGNYRARVRVKTTPNYFILPETKMYVFGQLCSLEESKDGWRCFFTPVVSILLPVITEQTKEITAAIGQAVTASVKATNADSYQWYFCDKDGQAYPWLMVDSCAQVTGENTSTLEFVPSPFWLEGGWPGDGVYVFCRVSNDTGYVYSDKIQVDVKPQGEGPSVPYVFPFTDVKSSDWFYNDVVYANKNGLINGKTATLYKPYDNMTIAEAIKLASCMHQLNKTGSVTLTNGSPNWYDSYVQYAKSNGISWNYSNYNAPVTREEYVHIFYGALPASSYKAINSVTSIPDVPSGSAYYKEILTFYNAGILTGNDPKGTFLPKSSIKRSEVAAILTRMMDDSARKTYTLVP